jgi:hypothetical protein
VAVDIEVDVTPLTNKLKSSLWKAPLRNLLTKAAEVAEIKAKNEAPKATTSMARGIIPKISTTKAVVSNPRNLDYYHVMEKGRRPGGGMPPLAAIRRWAAVKGISQNAVYPIARAIARRGIKGRFFMRQGYVATAR